MSFLLKLRRKLPLIIILSFLVILFLSEAGISHILNKSKPKILNYLKNTFAYRFDLERISFSFLLGLHIKGGAIFYDNQSEPPILIKDAFLAIKILPLIFKGTIAIQANINEALFLLNKEKEGVNLQVIFSDLYKKMPKVKPKALNLFKYSFGASIKTAKLIYTGNACFEKNMHLLMKNSRIIQGAERFKVDSDIELNYHLSKDTYISRFFKNKGIKEEVGYSIEGNIKGGDLIIDLILLNIGKDQIMGMGISKGFSERNPYIDIAFMNFTISLNNIASMKDNFNAKGDTLFSLKINGPMNNAKINATGSLHYCDFRYALANGELFDIKNLSGNLEYRDNLLKFDKVNLELNNVPLNAELLTVISDEPVITLKVSLSKDYLSYQNLPLEKLEAIFNGKLKNTLQGDLQINALYLRKGVNFNMRAGLKNIDFDYWGLKEKYFTATAMEITKDNASKIQKLNFSNLKAKVYTGRDRIEIKELNCYGYNAALNGNINLNTGDKTSLIIALEGLGLDVKTVMQDINISDKLLSGAMDIKITFDNQQKEFLKGSCYIKNGTANLQLLADTLKLPALKNVNFDIMDGRFSLSKDTIRVNEIKLANPDMTLNTSWYTNGKIDGALNLKIASGLLSQSLPFKKLLDLTEIKKPYIDFDFSLGGLPKMVRVMWLKGEFKDKIKQDLSAWVKRRIENQLDRMIDEMPSE